MHTPNNISFHSKDVQYFIIIFELIINILKKLLLSQKNENKKCIVYRHDKLLYAYMNIFIIKQKWISLLKKTCIHEYLIEIVSLFKMINFYIHELFGKKNLNMNYNHP